MGIEVVESQYYKPGFPINFKVKFVAILNIFHYRCY